MSDASPRHRITHLLAEINDGRDGAREELVPLVYEELHGIADALMRRETPGLTLQPTMLVDEAYLRLLGEDHPWDDRRHFYRAAARAMRRILVDHARKRQGLQRGGDRMRVELHSRLVIDESSEQDDLLALEEALLRFEEIDPTACEVVHLRYFSGLGVEETAKVLGMSPASVKREWATARLWLHRAIRGE